MVIEAYLYLVSRSACVNNVETSPTRSQALPVTQKARTSPSLGVSRKRNSTPTISDQPASKMLRELTYRIVFVTFFCSLEKEASFPIGSNISFINSRYFQLMRSTYFYLICSKNYNDLFKDLNCLVPS